MNLRVSFSTLFLKTVIRIICKVDADELSRIPMEGPGIIMINHINFLEVPLIQVCMVPRRMHGLVKKETWKNPFIRFFLNTYDAIPVNRGGVNLETFKRVNTLLEKDDFICIAPEGTRSGNGTLQKGRAGITSIALMSGAPIIPVVHQGGENIWKNLKRLRRTKVTIKAGKPFRIKPVDSKSKDTRKNITEEIMYQMAELLPEHMRGVYSDISNKSENYLIFSERQMGNLV